MNKILHLIDKDFGFYMVFYYVICDDCGAEAEGEGYPGRVPEEPIIIPPDDWEYRIKGRLRQISCPSCCGGSDHGS